MFLTTIYGLAGIFLTVILGFAALLLQHHL
jgi:hypothetical protein